MRYLSLLLFPALLSAQGNGNMSEQGMSDALLGLTVCYAQELQIIPRWHIGVRFQSAPKDEDWQAHTSADVDYLQAEIVYDTTRITNLRAAVVHELWHIRLWALGELAEEADSRQALREQEQEAQFAARVIAPRFCIRIPSCISDSTPGFCR